MGTKKYNVICDYCRREYLVDSSTYYKLQDGRQSKKYCSIECKALAQRKGEDIKCDYCGKTFYRKQYHINRQKKANQHNFCSQECEQNYRKKEAREVRLCEICGKEYVCKKTSTQRFCSQSCQKLWQKTQVGKLNKRYTQVECICPNCGTRFMVKKYKLKTQTYTLCSVKCRQEWYKNVISRTPEQIEIHRKCALDNLSKMKFSRTNSKPQQITDTILDSLGIEYQREYKTERYSIDNYLTETGLMIEVMGDYWHCNPLKHNRTNPENKIHANSIMRDIEKHQHVKNVFNVEILYLWENDLINNPTLCKKMILEYISKNGSLKNYHSFNYNKNEKEMIKMEF